MHVAGPLILASTSPYRRALLQRLALPFDAVAPDCDETALPGEDAPSLVLRLSELKARTVAVTHAGLIIGSDQVAVLDETLLGKPGSHENAVTQLQRLSGRVVSFYTGLCLLDTTRNEIQLDVVPYHVGFRELEADEIERYLHKEQPYNCAGSFRSEGLGIALFDHMEGDDPTALVGLPLIRLAGMLRSAGVVLP